MSVKNRIGVLLDRNALVDEGEGVVRVKGGLTLTQGGVRQHNGTEYDVKSMDIEGYDGRLFADHGDAWNGYTIDKIIGRLEGVTKKGTRVVAEKIRYAVDSNPLAVFAYNMTRNGWATDFSIGTSGDPPDEEGVYKNSSIVEVSQVGIGNHPKARLNEIAVNSLEQAKQNGLDTSEFERLFGLNSKPNKEEDMKTLVRVKNHRDFAVEVKYKNAEGAEEQSEVEAGKSVDVPEDQAADVEKQVDEAKEPEAPQNGFSKEDLAEAVNNAMTPLKKQIEDLEKERFNKNAQEPKFRPAGNSRHTTAENELKAMDWEERTADLIEANRRVITTHGADRDAVKRLQAINELHLEGLKEKKLIKNQMTIGDFDNFVISPEQLTEIQGTRNDYTPLTDMVTWRETLSIVTQWLKRSGDINMEYVEFCDDGYDGNLKPIKEYGATLEDMRLYEAAAVTPVCNAATRFLAVDMIGDISAGYRTSYDRLRAQLVAGRLQQAVNESGKTVQYDTSGNVDALNTFVNVWAELADSTPNGTFVLSNKSYAEILRRALAAGVNGPLSQLFTTGRQDLLFGRPYVLVTSDILPTLGTSESHTFQVGPDQIEVTDPVFYFNPSNFTGRISGGLNFDMSRDASYEVNGETRSAFQRNELVLRGSFFAGGAVSNTDEVAAIGSDES